MKYATTLNGQTYIIEINDDDHIIVDGKEYAIDFASVSGRPVYSLLINGRSHEAYVSETPEDWQVLLRGALYNAVVEDEREKRLRAAAGGGVAGTGEFNLKAPMPGLVVAVPVTEGQAVKKGDILVVLESMKMQNELKAPRDATVTRVKVEPLQSVEQNTVMVTLV